MRSEREKAQNVVGGQSHFQLRSEREGKEKKQE
jgi:hypothetical protein